MRYWITGCEGAGHHLFKYACEFKEDWQLNHWIAHPPHKKADMDIAKIDMKLDNALNLASYPYGDPHDPKRRPDLERVLRYTINYEEKGVMAEETWKKCEGKIIFIWRDPVEMTISKVNRCKESIDTIKKCVLENLIYMSDFMDNLIEPEVYDYHWICRNPETFTKLTGIPLNPNYIREAPRIERSEHKELREYFKENKHLYENFMLHNTI